jgi:alpha-galactosidase/6-phospho-beta-glucosidase family protein
MKVTFIGGGSFRTLPILRQALRTPGVLEGGEVQLLDLNVARAEVVGRMIQKTPEYRAAPVRIGWTDRAAKALEGADLVSLSMPVGSHTVCSLSEHASRAHGFHGGDQLSVSGSVRGLTGGRIVLDYARQMERLCPKAWFVIFANPVAIYSGLVNNHTAIRALGICGGFGNHRWDLTRLIHGRDEYRDEYDVDVAGINHLSFIVRGRYRGGDLYAAIGRSLARGWKPPRIPSAPYYESMIRLGLKRLAELYRRLGFIIFSTEGDGMIHLFFEEMMADKWNKPRPKCTRAQLRAQERHGREARSKYDAEFRAYLDRDLPDSFWSDPPEHERWLAPAVSDVTPYVMRALAGLGPQRFVASHPNRGAVRGFKDRTVLEYSMVMDRKGIRPTPDLEVPDPVHGLISSLATHQTLIGDAVATRDPKTLADALFAYPLFQNTPRARALFKDLLRIHAPEIDPVFQKAKQYL